MSGMDLDIRLSHVGVRREAWRPKPPHPLRPGGGSARAGGQAVRLCLAINVMFMNLPRGVAPAVSRRRGRRFGAGPVDREVAGAGIHQIRNIR
jgi:hypothetical protein